MLGIPVGWGGGTSTELAYMVVLDLAAKMAVGSRCDLVWCCCLQCLPSQANWCFLSPCWSRLSNDARVKCLSIPLPIFFRWPHLISFDLIWVFAWGIQSSRAWCSSDKARDNAIKDMRFCRWHGFMVSWLWNYSCNLLYKHMALWDLWTEQKQWTQGGSKDKTTSNIRHAGWIVLTDRVFLIDLCSLERERIWTFFSSYNLYKSIYQIAFFNTEFV